jgi:hypothetical protein
MKLRSVGLISALIYSSIALIVSGTFFAVTTVRGYDWVTRLGGAGWVFLLSMIILMPLVTPMVKRRLSGNRP